MDISCNKCSICIIITDLDRPFLVNYLPLCSQCTKELLLQDKLISSSSCKNKYSLTDSDLKKNKIVYLKNIKNKTKYYLFSDIYDTIIKKYGNINALSDALKMKEKNKEIKKINREQLIKQKKFELSQVLRNLNIDLNSYGNHFEYINYGKSTVDEIIADEKHKFMYKKKRETKLERELQKYGIQYNYNNVNCYNYVNKIGHKKLDDVISSMVLDNYKKIINV